jgi:hypothetical protein
VGPVRPAIAYEDSSVSAIFEIARRDKRSVATSGWGVARLLRQERKAQTPAKLDAIADTLATIAIQDPDQDSRMAALSELKVSAAPTSKAGGIPYPGAFDRLIRVHREAHDIVTRRVALSGILEVGDRERALGYLRQLATSDDETAWGAIEELAKDVIHSGGADSKALLKELYEKKLVRDPSAERSLLFFATAQGWVPPATKPGGKPPA